MNDLEENYRQTINSWNEVAVVYQEKFMDLNLYDDTYDTFCKLITKSDARILEIGCGPGNISKYIMSVRKDFNLTGTDVSQNMINLAQQNNPYGKFVVMDCRNIRLLDDRFDGIICGFVMPYLVKEDCVNLIKDISALINSGGIVYLSIIEGEYQNSRKMVSSDGLYTMFIFLYNLEFIKNQLLSYGFEFINHYRKEYQLNTGLTEIHLIVMARKL